MRLFATIGRVTAFLCMRKKSLRALLDRAQYQNNKDANARDILRVRMQTTVKIFTLYADSQSGKIRASTATGFAVWIRSRTADQYAS